MSCPALCRVAVSNSKLESCLRNDTETRKLKFARRTEGLNVLNKPESISRITYKSYLFSLLKVWFYIFIAFTICQSSCTSALAAPVLTTINSFPANGSSSYSEFGLLEASDGNLYGTTETGGVNNEGSIYRLTKTGTLTTIYSFASSAPNGYSPNVELLQGPDGSIYGTTAQGGTNAGGTLFKITLSGTLTTLYSFGTTGEGKSPAGAIAIDAQGNIYGSTASGGTGSCVDSQNNIAGCGTIFSSTPNGTVSTIYSFTDNTDGSIPTGLILASDGNLYGTCITGGVNNAGTVFKISTTGIYSRLYSFTGVNDGGQPAGQLTEDDSGLLWGATTYGGQPGQGTIYKISKTGIFSTVYSFAGSVDGAAPQAGLAYGSDGNFYGTVLLDNVNYLGTIFQLTPTGAQSTLFTFHPSADGTSIPDGGSPRGILTQASDGNLYGTTTGVNQGGTSFKLAMGLPIPKPKVLAFSPVGALPGSTIIILGKNFLGTTAVKFGSLTATFTVKSPNFIEAVVPVNVAAAPISVITPGGTAVSPTNFVILPFITSFTPTSGDIGAVVSITGANFDSVSNVKFNGTAATFTINSSTNIAATVPAGATSGSITITNAGGIANSTSFAIGLKITGFTPTSALPGSLITINGTRFTGATSVKFNNTAAQFTVVSASQITATLPTGSISGPISITTSEGTTVSLSNFLVSAALTGFIPPSGASRVLIIITGSGFTGATAVQFNGTAASFSVNSDTQITATVPVGATSGVVTVVTPAGIATSSTNFTVFPSVSFTSLNSFYGTATDRVAFPSGFIQADDGYFYGISYGGGSKSRGVIFKIASNGQTEMLYQFTGGADGGDSKGKLIQASNGNLYGTTYRGGANNLGTVFQFTKNGILSTLYSFNNTDGANPQTGLVQGSDGYLYGTTANGGANNFGTIFKISTSGTFSQLYSFSNIEDGANPTADLIQGIDGDFYGGSNGAVFKITSSGSFTLLNGGYYYPKTLFQTADGSLFGTAYYGGYTASSSCNACGMIFKMSTNGDLSVLYSFHQGGDGANPSAPLILASDGNFYGTANYGGAINTNCPSGCGTLYQMTPSGAFSLLYSFNKTDGSKPGQLLQASDGNVYGLTAAGGTNNSGTFFKLSSTFALPKPAITSFSPLIAPVGSAIELSGANFVGSTAVRFGSVPASFTVNSTGSITALVPVGAVNGQIQVVTPAGTATSAASFTVNAATSAMISSFSPNNGPVGSSVIVTGSNLSGVTSLQFNGVAANFTINSNSQISATVPANATSGLVRATNTAGITTASTAPFTVTVPPVITSFSPTSGPVGTSVVITGSQFTYTKGVQFNNVDATYVVNSSTKITATVPNGASNGSIQVKILSGAANSTTSFTVIATPTISSFTPSSAPKGASIVITGSNFTGASSVKFNGIAATFTVNSPTQITATVPSTATSGSISVLTPGGTATSSSFTVIPAPTITSFTPTSGLTGTTIVIAGTNFTNASSVQLNGTAASFTVNSATQITATIPSGATTGKITVITPGGSVTSSATYNVLPTIASFTPTSGPIGTSFVITGNSLSGTTAVKVNGTTATFTVNSYTQITATVPTGATTGKIAITTPGGTATSSTNFTIVAAPTITSFTPTNGAIGVSVVITGTNLTGATAVKFGTITATYTVNSATKITATVPTGVVTATFAVTTPGGTATSSTNFTIVAAPTITSFTPTSGAIGGSVVITGTNLTGATAVKFGTISATYTVNSATKITATVPTGATTAKIAVTTPGGTAASSTNFTKTP
jgi:uncharacterized repeat protein (TIGR03803 family)